MTAEIKLASTQPEPATARQSYEKPLLMKEDTNIFPFLILERGGQRLVCKQCSSCHGCR